MLYNGKHLHCNIQYVFSNCLSPMYLHHHQPEGRNSRWKTERFTSRFRIPHFEIPHLHSRAVGNERELHLIHRSLVRAPLLLSKMTPTALFVKYAHADWLDRSEVTAVIIYVNRDVRPLITSTYRRNDF